MIIEIPNENSIVKWKNDEKDEWKVAEISDLIKAYERPQGEWTPVSKGLPKDRDWYLGVFREPDEPDTGFLGLPYICDYVGEVTKGTTNEGWILRHCTDVDNVPDYFRNLICVAWQPLPEQYKKERKKRTINNDLISREALKDKLTDTINPNDIAKNEWYEGYAACVQVLSDLINNAPTVEIPNTSDNEVKQPCRKFYFADCIKEDCPYYEDCNHKRPKIERQHGKWVDHNFYVECNQCRVWFLKSHLIRKSFCPNCGADMRGKEE